MPEKNKKVSKSKKKSKKLTKAQKEEKEKKQEEKLEKELKEVSTEIKKIALNNKKVIIEDFERNEEFSKGLTSHNSGLDFSKAQASLDMVNAPLRRLVPLERTLRVETQAPSLLGSNNNNSNEEFNPFKYSTGSIGNSDTGPMYIKEFDSHYSERIGEAKRQEINELGRENPNIRKEVKTTPMYESGSKSEMEERMFNPPKRQDITELGREKESSLNKEIKYFPSGY